MSISDLKISFKNKNNEQVSYIFGTVYIKTNEKGNKEHIALDVKSRDILEFKQEIQAIIEQLFPDEV